MKNNNIFQELYLKPCNLYSEVERRLNELRIVQNRLEKKVPKYPDGKIHVLKSKSRIQYYIRKDAKDKSGSYLSKKQEDMIGLYLQKKYEQEVLREVKKEIDLLEKVWDKSSRKIKGKNTCKSTNKSINKLTNISSNKSANNATNHGKDNCLNIQQENKKNHTVNTQECIDSSFFINQKIQNIYSDNPKEIKKYIMPIDISDDDFMKKWLEEPYERKKIGEDLPVFITEKGDHVRSKSELNIANMLYQMNIPYKYECPLMLSNGKMIHPDFTILDIKKRREVYWEHRGMMDDRYYLKHAIERMREYSREGILLGDKLIVTEETSYLPLGTDEIQRIANLFI